MQLNEAIDAAARRIGLESVELGAKLLEELKRDEWGSTLALRVQNVVDHLGRILMSQGLPRGGQIEFEAFQEFDPAALASWDLVASEVDGHIVLDLLAVTPM